MKTTCNLQNNVAWPYPVGNIGEAWNEENIQQWRERANNIQRSYQEEVVSKLHSYMKEESSNVGLRLFKCFNLIQYGSLSQNKNRYPLYLLQTKPSLWNKSNPTVLITGGVHGYETSGVQGALSFIQQSLLSYHSQFNFVIVPCVSPWGYETIQRWSINAVDVNRSFVNSNPTTDKATETTKGSTKLGSGEGRTEESAQLMDWIDDNLKPFGGRDCVDIQLDLHETTDTDATEFRPAKFSREGKTYDFTTSDNKIPIGFYLVGNKDSEVRVRSPFCRAIIGSVSQVTKICHDRYILGLPSEAQDGTLEHDNEVQDPETSIGVIYVSARSIGLCAGMTNADLAVTTEVYPDADGVTAKECNEAQCRAIIGALDYFTTTIKK